MGSSTVDVAGVIGATAAAAGLALSPSELVRLVTAVEPSDSSALPGLWAIDHVAGTRAVPLCVPAPAWHLVAVDGGTPVETLHVHRTWGAGPCVADDTLARLARDAFSLAHVATESALRNQERLPHPAFDTIRDVVAATNALGICVAHSGSVCAAICDGAWSASVVSAALRAHGLSCNTWLAAAPGMRVAARAAAS
jgi:L-threonine kinase